MEALVAVAVEGSLSSAARSLGVSQPTVSAALARLETMAGTPLLVRGPHGTDLTAQGRRLARACDLAVRSAEHADDELSRIASDSRHRVDLVRVAASMTVAEVLLPGWLEALTEGTRVVMEVANSARVGEAVAAGEADLGFVEGVEVPAGLGSRKVADDDLCVVVRRQHPLARSRRPVDAATLVGQPLVVREVGSGTRQVLEAALAATGHDLPAEHRELASTSASLTAVRLGRVAVMSRAHLAHQLAVGDLVEVPTTLDLRRDLTMVWRPPLPAPAALLAAVACGEDPPAQRVSRRRAARPSHSRST